MKFSRFLMLWMTCLVLIRSQCVAADEEVVTVWVVYTWKNAAQKEKYPPDPGPERDNKDDAERIGREMVAARRAYAFEVKPEKRTVTQQPNSNRPRQDDFAGTNGTGGTIVQPSPGNKAASTKRWAFWLEESRNGRWIESPGKRSSEYDDYDAFRSAFEEYRTRVEPFNRNGRRYQMNWKEIDLITKPDLPIVDAKPIERFESNEQLAGKHAVGTLGTRGGGTKFTVKFSADGSAQMMTAEEGKIIQGTWNQSGNIVSMKAGTSSFTGVIEGKRLSGERSRRQGSVYVATQDTWYLNVE